MKINFRKIGIILMFFMIIAFILQQVWMCYVILIISFIFYVFKMRKLYKIKKERMRKRLELYELLLSQNCLNKCMNNDYTLEQIKDLNIQFNCNKKCFLVKILYMRELKSNNKFLKMRFKNRK